MITILLITISNASIAQFISERQTTRNSSMRKMQCGDIWVCCYATSQNVTAVSSVGRRLQPHSDLSKSHRLHTQLHRSGTISSWLIFCEITIGFQFFQLNFSVGETVLIHQTELEENP